MKLTESYLRNMIKQVINDYKHQLENPGYKPSKFIKMSLNEMIQKA